MNIKMKAFSLTVLLLLLGTCIYVIFLKPNPTQTAIEVKKHEKVVVNEALRTLLYLPLYHAKEAKFFEHNGINVEIVTGGTAANAFAAMTSGEADFALADPMYVPISNEKNADTRVVLQAVSKIAVWGLTMDTSIIEMNSKTMRDKTISTQIRPMTAYTYTVKTVSDVGLNPSTDVNILENKPGSEIIPMLLGQAHFAMTLEPNVSNATSQGAKVVLSYPQILGDQIFTGMMAKQDYINKNKEVVSAVLKSYQEALNDIYANKEAALITAQKYFPQLKLEVLSEALNRILNEEVFPRSILMSEESWDKAIEVRVNAGDLKTPTSRGKNVTVDLINDVLKEMKK